MEPVYQEFFHNFRQEFLTRAEIGGEFQLSSFMGQVTDDLIDTGIIEGFELCHYRAQRGMRVDGYWFSDEEGTLELFVADFENRSNLDSLTRTDADAIFKRLVNFFTNSANKRLYRELEETSPEYGLARLISERKSLIYRVKFFLISERALSERVRTIESSEINHIPADYQIWEISRLQRQQSSRGQKEVLDLNLVEMFDMGIPCIRADLGKDVFASYLAVIPGKMLSSLYDKFGPRLLEQNVRSFLQARGKVNRGIRTTILNEPDMFFAYNNGITATAEEVEIQSTANKGFQISRIKDFQIVNGGQTTASLFHTQRNGSVCLDEVFVQMKLSVIDSKVSEEIVPKISEYANTQNRVNAADFFSNHPFHIRIEEFSRRIWAPVQQGTGAQRETKWFYERARGQYADEQSKLSNAKRREFRAKHPRHQMFTKTDLAKFENVWDEHPKWVNLGAQKNFSQFAMRIGNSWEKSQKQFNELYFKRVVARAILFKKTEKLISAASDSWYRGGYRANAVAYTLALLAEYCSKQKKSIDFKKIWDTQDISKEIENALKVTSEFVYQHITKPREDISNVSEWCKKEGCWTELKSKMKVLEAKLPNGFSLELIDESQVGEETKIAEITQTIDNGINAQTKVLEIPAEAWRKLLARCLEQKVLTPKEVSILEIAVKIPRMIPSGKQSQKLIEILEKAKMEGILIQ